MDSRRVGIDAYLMTSKRSMPPTGPQNTLVWFLWWTVAAKNAGKWFRGVFEASERCMAKWHDIEVTLSRNRHTSATGGPDGNRKGEGNNCVVTGKPRLTRAGRRWQTG